jgi:DNA-directed RNA polymerase specialized sigma24 family protein
MTTSIYHRLQENREQVFRELYRSSYPAVAKKLKGLGARREDTRDIFQDALIVLYEKSRRDASFRLDHPRAYLCEVSRRLWLRKQGSELPLTGDDANDDQFAIPADFYAPPKSDRRLVRLLERAGQKCLEILQAFYYHEWSLGEITRQFGYSSVRSATVQKYKCLEKVRAYAHQKTEEHAKAME